MSGYRIKSGVAAGTAREEGAGRYTSRVGQVLHPNLREYGANWGPRVRPGGFHRVRRGEQLLCDLMVRTILLFECLHLVFQAQFQLLQPDFLKLLVFG